MVSFRSPWAGASGEVGRNHAQNGHCVPRFRRRGAHRASVPRSGLSRRVRSLRGPYAPPHQRPPCVKGPQGSAACGRTSDRSGPAAACLGGPQRGPGRLSGNPGLSAARLTGGLSTPPALRATSPYTGEALVGAFGAGALAAQPDGRLLAAPTAELQVGAFAAGAP